MKEKSDHGKDVQAGSFSNPESMSSQPSEGQHPDEYAYIVDRKTAQTKGQSLVFENAMFGKEVQNSTSVGPETVYYETASPEPEEYTYIEKTDCQKPQGNNETIAIDSEYAGLDGTHGRAKMTHSPTEGNYY